MILLFLLLGISAGASIPEGQERGGGKQVELEFAEIGRLSDKAIAESLRAGEGAFSEFRLDAYGQALVRTEIWASPDICEEKVDPLTGGAIRRCLDARYLPELNRIELSEKEWTQKTCLEKAALAVHEYGRASGNEDGNYRFSSQVKNSQAFRDACDLFERDQERDQIRRCEPSVAALKASLSEARESYKRKESEKHAQADFIVTMKYLMGRWGKVNGAQCSVGAEEACFEACTDIAGLSCVGICQLRR